MIRLFMRLYAWFRGLFDKKKPVKDSYIEAVIKECDIDKYSRIINDLPYRSDKIGGFIDRTASIEHFFDINVASDRDCDDFARAWSYWGNYHGYDAYEYIILNPCRPFRTAHVVTVLQKGREIILCNYRPYWRDFKSRDEAVEYMENLWASYKNGLRYVLYKEFRAA